MLRNFFLLLLITHNLSCQNINDLKIIESKDYSITYPSNLKLDKSGVDGTDFVLFSEKQNKEDNFVENINLIVQDFENTFEDFEIYINDEIKKVAMVKESLVIENHNQKIHKMVYTLNQNGVNLTFIQHGLIKNKKLYILTFSGESKQFDDYSKQMENIMLSFRLTR